MKQRNWLERRLTKYGGVRIGWPAQGWIRTCSAHIHRAEQGPLILRAYGDFANLLRG
jgi:hypothetical protein